MTHTSTQQPEALRLADAVLTHDEHPRVHLYNRVAAELRRQHERIAELEAQLSAIGAGGVEPLRKQAAASQAVPASVIAGAVFDFAGYLTTLPHKEAIHCSEAHEAAPMVEAITEWCTRRNLATDGAKVETWRDHLAEAPAHPAEGVPVQTETLLAELAEETEAAENWRRLALQFDHHRLQALGHLKAILHPDSSVDEYKTAELFLKAPPLDGESVLAQRIAKLSAAATQAQADARDVERWMGIGKAIERACMDLPDGTEISVSLEKDAGTVTLIDQDGNEHENFSCDYGFAGVLNEAIDAALAAQAKKGEHP